MRFSIKTQDGQLIKKCQKKYLISNINSLFAKYAIVIVERPDLVHSTKMSNELKKGYYDHIKAKIYFP